MHAEMNAIISASRAELMDSSLYLYGEENGKTIDAEPCDICRRMLVNAGVAQMICIKANRSAKEELFDAC